MVTVANPLPLKDVEELRTARIKERAKAIRRLCRGRGMSVLPYDADVDPALFGVSTAVGIRDALLFAINLMPRSPLSSKAILNALIGQFRSPHSKPEGDLLQARRVQFAERHGISTRTVMRLEEEGASLVAETVDRIFSQDYLVEVVTRGLRLAITESTTVANTCDVRRLKEALDLVHQARN